MDKLWVDIPGRRVMLRGCEINLRSKTFGLLCVLLERRGQSVPADDIMRDVWPERMPTRETLKSTVQHLRTALGDTAEKSEFIETKRGVGYAFIGAVGLAQETTSRLPSRAFPVIVFVECHDGSDLRVAGLLKAHLENDLAQFETLCIQFAELASSDLHSLGGMRSAAHDAGAEFIVSLRLFRNVTGHQVLVQIVHGATGAIIWAERFQDTSDQLCQTFPYGPFAQRIEKTVTQYADRRLAQTTPRTAMDYCQIGLATQPDNAALNARAQRAFEMALSLDEEHSRAWAGLAEARYNQAFLEYSDDPDTMLDRAMQDAQRATALAPDAARPIWITGKILQLRHDWCLAEKFFLRAIELNPNDADAQAMMGSYLMDAGRAEEAIAFLKRSIALNPKHESRAFWALGAAQYNLGQYHGAIDCLNAVLIRRPDFSRPYRLVAASYAMMGRVGKAREITRTHLDKNSKNTISSAETYMRRVSRERRDIDHLLAGFEKAGFPS